MICGMWELKKTVLLCSLTQTEKSPPYHFFTTWHFNNYNWHFYFMYLIQLLNYCPRFSRVKNITAFCHMIDWPPGYCFPSYLSCRCVNAPSRLKTLGSIKCILHQRLSFSSSESPDLQRVFAAPKSLPPPDDELSPPGSETWASTQQTFMKGNKRMYSECCP